MILAVLVMLIMVLLVMLKLAFEDTGSRYVPVKQKLVDMGMEKASAQVKMIGSVPEILIGVLRVNMKAVAPVKLKLVLMVTKIKFSQGMMKAVALGKEIKHGWEMKINNVLVHLK
ncbi:MULTISPECIES: hypothetical protein [Methanobacterium]|uniref:Uncharacterized protein n=1 Tax=Methanobacterium subterraneum TaxID=59277 RepID=A0A2H4VNS7_9EURY|nr:MULTISPECIES: hypothetical protein [Methanobacterium]AUB58765.1 hypothetical protein BK008_10900 [Methanobacterium sp. MZ-A1]AUB59765.1 hypothetical protein BK009_03190 [Methanobacterium subterraneum]NMO08244.1 hypothetical protein [Methanobacterium subterraneum]PKL73533.1 MAG: hypothetical protein CVV29_02970 [Methanobacteriales archaeon HGW-Methanobacteriales-2]